MRPSIRSRDDADVIRARLRALLSEDRRSPGWVPEDDDAGAALHQPVRTGSAAGGSDGDDDGDDDSDDGCDDGNGRRPGPAGGGPGSHLPFGLGRHRAPGRTTRIDPGRPGAGAMWVAAVLAAAAVVGWSWLDRPAVEQVSTSPTTEPTSISGSAPGEAAPPVATPGATPSATPSATPGATPGADLPPAAPASTPVVVVSVVGQVTKPGLVTLPAGARVADALAAVGGLAPEADPASVNAAAVLSDGQQIAVGVPGAVPAAAGGAGAVDGSAGGGLLDLNSATVVELDALPGIGPVLAQRIVDHRTAHGRFTSADQLDDVGGIGPAVLADIVGRVRV